MNLGYSIKQIRKQRQISQGELAIACNITQAYLSQIENNKREPNLTILKVISTNLNVPLPLIFFQSMNANDVPNYKQDSFKEISKSIDLLINEIYFND